MTEESKMPGMTLRDLNTCLNSMLDNNDYNYSVVVKCSFGRHYSLTLLGHSGMAHLCFSRFCLTVLHKVNRPELLNLA